MCGMFKRPKNQENSYKNVKDFKSNDIGTYVAALKIGTINVVKGDILNKKFLKLYSNFPEKLVLIA